MFILIFFWVLSFVCIFVCWVCVFLPNLDLAGIVFSSFCQNLWCYLLHLDLKNCKWSMLNCIDFVEENWRNRDWNWRKLHCRSDMLNSLLFVFWWVEYVFFVQFRMLHWQNSSKQRSSPCLMLLPSDHFLLIWYLLFLSFIGWGIG